MVEHGNSAVIVTVASDGVILDRRRIDLTEKGLPTHPHRHEGSWAARDTMGTKRPATIDEYIRAAPRAGQPHLRRLHAGLQAVRERTDDAFW